MEQLTLFDDGADQRDEYAEFVAKFAPKRTSDDCFTPPVIYAAVEQWVRTEYRLPADCIIVRPFWPGADYTAQEYPVGCVVIDNPPFSRLTEITRYYDERAVRYFLFAPTLTLFSGECAGAKIPCGVSLTYANGARVNTSFISNLEAPDILARTAPDLFRRLRDADAENLREQRRQQPTYTYPPEVISAATMSTLTKHGQDLVIRRDEAQFIRTLDAQRPVRKSIFGAGYLLSSAATARKVEAEEAAAHAPIYGAPGTDEETVWQLSERERGIIARLDGNAAALPLEVHTDDRGPRDHVGEV